MRRRRMRPLVRVGGYFQRNAVPWNKLAARDDFAAKQITGRSSGHGDPDMVVEGGAASRQNGLSRKAPEYPKKGCLYPNVPALIAQQVAHCAAAFMVSAE